VSTTTPANFVNTSLGGSTSLPLRCPIRPPTRRVPTRRRSSWKTDALASDVVRRCSTDVQQGIAADAAGQEVTMTSSRMAGDGVLAMALGEYIIHAWDLATATGQPYDPPTAAVAPAHEFLLGMVKPEYRGPDTGFFDAEVEVPGDASALDRLLGFAGRDPNWVG
jgi:uncharacterized protein (TIGR03086 family)